MLRPALCVGEEKWTENCEHLRVGRQVMQLGYGDEEYLGL